MTETARPTVCDDDRGTVYVRWHGKIAKTWPYQDAAEQKQAIRCAREYASGIALAWTASFV